MARTSTPTPLAFGWIWALAIAAAAAALVALYGFQQPLLSTPVIRIVLITALALFALSRVVLLFPGSEALGRLQRWWVDYVLLLAAGLWWAIEPHREPVILRVGALYVVALGLGAGLTAALRALAGQVIAGRLAGLTWRVAALLTAGALAGGLTLSLPACWAASVTGQKLTQHLRHVLDCIFTATAAITCTGLTPLELGDDFSLAGQIILLVLLQTGGLTALLVGTALGIRLRELGGGHGLREAPRLLRASIVAMVIFELLGAIVLYTMWDESRDPAFAVAAGRPAIAGLEPQRVLFSLFHAVSAFCNGGLSLSRGGLSSYAWTWQAYGAILPLMILGSIGGPTLYEVWSRLRRRGRTPLSGHARLTLGGTLLLLVGGALAIWSIESSRRWQLRFPRVDTPGRLQVEVSQTQAHDGVPRSDRLPAMPAGARLAAAGFVSAAARSGGFDTVRLDEASLSPASRWVLMLLMLVGGGIGGTAGGVRILTAVLCLRAVLRPGRDAPIAAAAWAVTGAMLLLIAASSLVLIYRDVGSVEASLFESVSAACNVGLTTGLTRRLYVESQIVLIITMLLGRAVPLGLLARLGESRPTPAGPAQADSPLPIAAAAHRA